MFFDPPEKFRDFGEDFPRPRRLYARVDLIEGDIESDGVVLFGCVSSDWVDRQADEATPIAERLEEDGSDIDRALFILSIALVDFKYLTQQFEEQARFAIELGDPCEGKTIAEQYAKGTKSCGTFFSHRSRLGGKGGELNWQLALREAQTPAYDYASNDSFAI